MKRGWRVPFQLFDSNKEPDRQVRRGGQAKRTCRDFRKSLAGPPRRAGLVGTALAAALLVLVFSGTAVLGQQKGKKQSPKNEPPMRVPEEQVVNMGISEMLGAWQIGDVELLQKYYADDVVVVSGAYEPPVMGWANYLQAYQRQRERMQQVRLDRRNTYVNVKGNLAWAAYQWDFVALVDGKPTGYRGHTTLILEKRKDRWLIVHNHTSLIPEVQAAQPTPPSGPPKPGAKSP